MKRRTFILLVIVILPVCYIFYLASSLIALVFEDGLKDSVSFAALEAIGNRSSASHPIPKIIHQTWKNNDIPEQWQIAQFTWYVWSLGIKWANRVRSIDLHPDYHYMVFWLRLIFADILNSYGLTKTREVSYLSSELIEKLLSRKTILGFYLYMIHIPITFKEPMSYATLPSCIMEGLIWT